MPDAVNFLNDPERRYKIMWITETEIELGPYRNQVLTYLNDRLGSCEPGTTIARIYFDVARQCHGIVLHNLAWPATIAGEELPTYRPLVRRHTQALEEPYIIDVEIIYDEPKELEDHGKTT